MPRHAKLIADLPMYVYTPYQYISNLVNNPHITTPYIMYEVNRSIRCIEFTDRIIGDDQSSNQQFPDRITGLHAIRNVLSTELTHEEFVVHPVVVHEMELCNSDPGYIEFQAYMSTY